MIIALLFLAVGLLLSFRKPHVGIAFVLIHNFILMWTCLRFSPADYSIVGTCGTVFIYLLVVIYWVQFRTELNPYVSKLIIFYVLFSVFLFINAVVHKLSVIDYLLFFRNYFHYTLLVPIFICAIKQRKLRFVLISIGIIIFLQVALSAIQLIYPPIKAFLYIEFINRGNGFERLVSESVVKGNAVIGTFMRPANLGNFLAIIIPAIYYLKATDRIRINRFIFISMLILLFYILINTGIRTSLFSLLLMFAGTIFVVNRRHFTILIVTLILFFGTITTYVATLSSQFDKKTQFENPIIRLAGIFAGVDDNSSFVQNSTLRRTNNILNYADDFLWGNGSYMAGETYAGISSITDATLGFLFVEFGIIIFFMAFTPVVLPLKMIRANKAIPLRDFHFALVLFLGVLTQTVTDQGFFTSFSGIPYYGTLGILIGTSLYKHSNNNTI